MFDVAILTVIPELNQEFDTLLPLVSPEKQERIRKFRFFRDARNCLLGKILIRTEICRTTGLNNKQLEFSMNEYGKPFLINKPHIHFNISHAGNYITCTVSDEPVGVDIEIVKPIDLKIIPIYFLMNYLKILQLFHMFHYHQDPQPL
jgi:4'-phosphopantetheinyl transferase